MIVLGIDPAVHGFHGALLHLDGERDELYLVRAKADGSKLVVPSAVVSHVFTGLTAVLDTCAQQWGSVPDAVFIEEPVVAGARNIRTTIRIALSVGAMVAAVTGFTQKCYLVPVSRWKMCTVGAGNASKHQISHWLSELHPAYSAQCAANQDFIDACCIARYGVGVLEDSLLVGPLPGPL